MGYYTYYQLETKPPKLPKEFKEQFEEITGHELAYLDDDRRKWYDHEEHMVQLSSMYPDYYFMLHGDGEENDNIWIKHFYRGNCYTCNGEVVFPEPDMEKLGNPKLHSPELFI